MSRRITWPHRLLISGLLAAAVIALMARGRGHAVRPAAAAARPPRPLAAGDADRDGIPDAFEAELAARYAPIVILDPREEHRPASIDWLSARGLLTRLGSGGDQFSEEVRAGSREPRDWVTYVHVYPRVDGGVALQYWFFYPYNQAPLPLFNHEGDWEHVTVELGPGAVPHGVSFAQHGNNDPGAFRGWQSLRKAGDHPVVLSALGTHASYPDQASVSWFDRTSACTSAYRCPDPLWRTWQGGGLVNVGEPRAMLGARDALAYDGRWGGEGHFLRSRAAPRGPAWQSSFRNGGFD